MKSDYLATNRDIWNADAANWVELAGSRWSLDTPAWGTWDNPEATLKLLGDEVIARADEVQDFYDFAIACHRAMCGEGYCQPHCGYDQDEENDRDRHERIGHVRQALGPHAVIVEIGVGRNFGDAAAQLIEVHSSAGREFQHDHARDRDFIELHALAEPGFKQQL